MRWLGGVLSLLSLVALAALLRSTDWREVVQALAGSAVEWLAVAVALTLAVEVVKTLRWQLLLGVEIAALPGLLSVVFTSRLLNVLAPLRAGDLWRVGSAARANGRPLVAAGGSVIIEKALDGAVLAGIGAALVWPGDLRISLAIFPLGAGLAVVGAIVVGWRLGARVRWLGWASSLGHLRDWRLLGAVVALTLAGLGLGVVANLAVLRAVGLPADMAPGLVMLLSGYAVGLVPGMPGRVGTFELGIAAPLTTIGIAPAASIGAAVALHAVLLVSLVVGGLVALPLGVQGRRQRKRETEGQGAAASGG